MEAVELRRLSMPLVAPFVTAFGAQDRRDVLLLRSLDEDGGWGWGECVAPAEPGYTAEFTQVAALVLREHLVPRVLGADLRPEADLHQALGAFRGYPMAIAAIEMSLLDLDLRRAGISLAEHLGATVDRVPAGVAVGFQPSIETLLEVVTGYVDAGYRRVKLKIGPGWDLEPVAAVRDRFGTGLSLQVDANGAYQLSDADHLAELDAFGLLAVEQPLAVDALAEHIRLSSRLMTPICLDESIRSAREAAGALDLGACRIVSIKAGRLGGLLEARNVHDVVVARGAGAWCGGMLETGVGRAASLAVAALPGCNLPGDLSASDRYYALDVTPPFLLEEGCLAVPDGPGLGVDVDEDVLAELTTSVELVRADRS
ncbi:MAG: o-succinylbenzoate synthase [Acidimicrobiales bacterium]